VWSRERIEAFLLRRYPILIVLVIIVVFLLSIFLPLSTFIELNGNLGNEVNPTVVNGILTATSIVFGFVALELREIKSSTIERFLLSLPMLAYMMVTLEFYFIAVIVGKTTTGLVLEVTSNCLFNIFYSVPLVIAKGTHEEIERKTKI
jgi:hypothetical protein